MVHDTLLDIGGNPLSANTVQTIQISPGTVQPQRVGVLSFPTNPSNLITNLAQSSSVYTDGSYPLLPSLLAQQSNILINNKRYFDNTVGVPIFGHGKEKR